ncbi:hypothetical protein TIFTF001_009045 [Ficus carica]|uniref:Fasciclin-like arabinogalactan protein n=1 Tax=Ficus carica TaxID=3494 RepID=A0AA87ZP57_FICCA|nr:hypothetical protein TIFTF001_009045 [Ficus carica]
MKNSIASPLLFLSLLLLYSSNSLAFNITRILSPYPEFASLNGLLSQSKVAEEINSRRTLTVLVFDNAEASAFSGKPVEVIKKILSVHVILDYYDVKKLTELGVSTNTSTLTTLFQASGSASGKQGFISVSLVNEGEIAFGAAAKGGALNSKLVKSVAAQPYNISVLQITTPIQVPGIESAPATAPPPKPAAAPVPVPAAPKKSPTPAPVPSKKKPGAPAPAPVVDVIEVPVEAPIISAPVSDSPESDSNFAPVSDAPESSPPKPADAAVAETPSTTSPSAGSRREVAVGAGMVMAALVSCLVV